MNHYFGLTVVLFLNVEEELQSGYPGLLLFQTLSLALKTR